MDEHGLGQHRSSQDHRNVDVVKGVPEGLFASKDLPETPTTTISAVLGPTSALEQESTSRTAAQNLRDHEESKINERYQQKTKTKQNKDKSKKQSSPFKEVLKSLKPNGKKGRALENRQRADLSEKHNDAAEDAYDSCRGIYVRKTSGFVDSRISTPGYPVPPSLQQFTFTPNYTGHVQDGAMNARNLLHPYLCAPVLSPANIPNTYYHYQQPQPMDYSITLGGQIPDRETNRFPSTFFTPTNADTYAISGRGHLMPGHHVVSQHADVHNTTNQPQNPLQHPTMRSIFASTPTVQFATDNDRGCITGPADRVHQEAIPGVPFSMDHLDAHLNHPSYRSLIKGRSEPADKSIRRSASVPADMMLRESAVPAPLKIEKVRTGSNKVEKVTVARLSMDKKDGGIKDEFVVAAFDGVHKHIEEVKRELWAKVTRVEDKVDRLCALLAAPAANMAEHKKKHQQQQQQQQREIRSNLTGLPPHIPFGGMEGWYNAVKK